MYVTVRNYAGNPGLIDELVKNEDAVKSLISAIDGFHAYYLVRTDSGDAMSISVYEDKNGAEESTRAAAGWIGENLSDLSIGPPSVAAGETVIAF